MVFACFKCLILISLKKYISFNNNSSFKSMLSNLQPLYILLITKQCKSNLYYFCTQQQHRRLSHISTILSAFFKNCFLNFRFMRIQTQCILLWSCFKVASYQTKYLVKNISMKKKPALFQKLLPGQSNIFMIMGYIFSYASIKNFCLSFVQLQKSLASFAIRKIKIQIPTIYFLFL